MKSLNVLVENFVFKILDDEQNFARFMESTWGKGRRSYKRLKSTDRAQIFRCSSFEGLNVFEKIAVVGLADCLYWQSQDQIDRKGNVTYANLFATLLRGALDRNGHVSRFSRQCLDSYIRDATEACAYPVFADQEVRLLLGQLKASKQGKSYRKMIAEILSVDLDKWRLDYLKDLDA